MVFFNSGSFSLAQLDLHKTVEYLAIFRFGLYSSAQLPHFVVAQLDMATVSTSTDRELNKPVPYKLHLDDDLLTLTKKKLELARFPEELTDLSVDDWSQGAKVKVVRSLAEYWIDGYDWRAEEACRARGCFDRDIF